MSKRTSRTAGFAASVLLSAALAGGLGGCSFATDALWPSLTGDSPNGARPQQLAIAPSAAESNPQPILSPPLGSTNFAPPGVTPGQPTGTFVGQKVAQMRSELGQLQQSLVQRNSQLQSIRTAATNDSQQYHGTLAAVTTRLQRGTTPGNPILVNQWNQAQASLDRLAADIAAMSSLGNELAADSGMAAYLLQTARSTYALSGAIDEDHRQLSVLEDETNRTVVTIDRAQREVSEDVSRQTNYIGGERGNLTTLSLAIKNGELYGPSLASHAYAGLGSSALPSDRTGLTDGRTPLVVIRFDRADVPYQQALYSAVSKALERAPQAQFDLVAVTAAQGNPGQTASNQTQSLRNADRVMRTLTDMGLPASRVSTSSASAQLPTNEVRLYVRYAATA